MEIDKLIINTEFFLQCSGSCSGCFLTEEERQSENTYYNEISKGLSVVAEKYNNIHIPFLVIGFGRGNTLNLHENGINKLIDLMKWCRGNFSFDEVIFEISTSLIGKLDKQIENAKYIIEREEKAYFNMVINSEITSKSFWNNVASFHSSLSLFRTEKYNITDGNADILVLNVNPKKLPSISELKEFTKDYNSPVNISIFPFNKGVIINKQDIDNVKNWSSELWNEFKHKDLNIKNFLNGLNSINMENNIQSYKEYSDMTIKSYIFIDKNSEITEGSLSVMGEVDKIRLMDKFSITLSIENGYKNMMKNKHCRKCEFQKQCLLSGSYLNLMANNKNIIVDKDSNGCLSGYQELFRLSLLEKN